MAVLKKRSWLRKAVDEIPRFTAVAAVAVTRHTVDSVQYLPGEPARSAQTRAIAERYQRGPVIGTEPLRH